MVCIVSGRSGLFLSSILMILILTGGSGLYSKWQEWPVSFKHTQNGSENGRNDRFACFYIVYLVNGRNDRFACFYIVYLVTTDTAFQMVLL